MMRQQWQSRGLLAVTGIAVLLGVGVGGTASAKGKLKTKQTALFLITADGPNPDVVQAIARALPAVTARAPRLRLVTGMELRRRIGKQPTKALDACGANFRCLAKLGAKADAQRMVIVRVTPGDTGTRIQFVVIDVGEKVMTARIELDIAATTEVEAQLERNFFNIFGVGLASKRVRNLSTGDLTDKSDAAPATDAAVPEAGPASADAATTADQDPEVKPFASDDAQAMKTPDKGQEKTVAEASGSGLDLEMIPEIEAVFTVPPEEPTIAADYVMGAGFGLFGVGIVVGVIGVVFGANGQAAGAAIIDDVPQTDAIRRRQEANRQIDMANNMYIAGGATAVVGAAMVVLGLIEPGWLGGGQADVVVTNGGAQLSLRFPW